MQKTRNESLQIHGPYSIAQVHTNVPPWFFAEFGQDSRPIRGRLVHYWVRHLPSPSLTQNNAFPLMMHPDCESYVATSLHPQSKSLSPAHTYTHWLEDTEERAQEPSSFVRECTMRTGCKGLFRNPVRAAHAIVYRLRIRKHLVHKKVVKAECKGRDWDLKRNRGRCVSRTP